MGMVNIPNPQITGDTLCVFIGAQYPYIDPYCQPNL